MTRKLRLKNLFPSVRRSFRRILLFGSVWPQTDCRLPRNTKGGGLRPSRASSKCVPLLWTALPNTLSGLGRRLKTASPSYSRSATRSRLCTSRATPRSSIPSTTRQRAISLSGRRSMLRPSGSAAAISSSRRRTKHCYWKTISRWRSKR